MNMFKVVVAILLALACALLGGWFWGTRGGAATERALTESGLRLHVATARSSLLQARVHLFEVNFGNASRSLDAARADLVTLEGACERDGRTEAVTALRTAMTRVAEAQQMTARLDQSAQAATAGAIEALEAATPFLR